MSPRRAWLTRVLGEEDPAAHRADRSGVDCPVDLAEIRFERAVAKLHALGVRVLYQFLDDLGAQRLIRRPIEALLDTYIARLGPVILAAAGGDRFVPRPLWIVPPAPVQVVAWLGRV